MEKKENYTSPMIEQHSIVASAVLCQSIRFSTEYGTEFLEPDEDYEL